LESSEGFNTNLEFGLEKEESEKGAGREKNKLISSLRS
jgi:hypothetical protein